MGFYIYTGNKLEVLAKHKLCKILSEQPLKDPFKQERIIVQSQGMSSWLKLQIADNIPICANIDFPFLYSFIKDVLEKTLTPNLSPDIELYTHDVLIWKIFDILPEITENFPELSSYLSGRNLRLKQFQLSEKISYSFDQYEIFRPDILLNWKNNIVENKSNDWQAKIWQKISKYNTSRSQGFLNFFTSADLSKLDYERIFVFGITTMPAVYINFFQILGNSGNIDIHFFYLNPCKENWEYNLSQKEEVKVNSLLFSRNVINPEDFVERGNPLLSSFGQTGREFFSAILENTEYSTEDCFIETENTTILEQIQNNILKNEPAAILPPQQQRNDDISLQFHNCHNKTREIEVLYDNLLNLIQQDKTIQPGDIIVTTPDISAYEPHIKSVFNRRNKELSDNPILPFSLSDIKIAKNSKVVKSFIKLLEQVNSKYRMSEILDILETCAIREAFNIEDENIDLLRKWADESGMRWGIDAEHRSDLGLPAFEENSITSGLNRLMLGFAMEDTDIIYNDSIIPYNEIEIAESELLGKFSYYLSSLSNLRKTLSNKFSINQWHSILNSVIDDFFESNNDTFKDVSFLINVIDSLKESAELAKFETEVSLDIIKSYITEHIEAETVYEGFLRGKITFCTMLPMRGIPAKVICMLGMNDGEFPRQETKLGFNIINKEIRLCDRSKKLEDKYIFLESILAARKNLYISYIGQSDKSDEIYPPAGPVCELIDYLKQLYGEKTVQTMILNHKLQAFNSIYFNSSHENFFSYSAVDCNAARTLMSEKNHSIKIYKELNIRNNGSSSTIELEELINFFKNPCKAFLNQTLNASYPFIDKTETLDTEPFSINSLEKYTLTQKLLETVINNNDKKKLYQKLKHSGLLQIGIEGEFYFNNLFTQVDTLLKTSYKDIKSPKELIENTNNIDFEFALYNNFSLKGNLDNVSNDGYQVYLRLARESGKRALECWLKHLCLCASGFGKKTFYFICKPGERVNSIGIFDDISKKEAIQYLAIITSLYKEGMKKPIPFFPESSYAFAKKNKQKIQYAKSIFAGNSYSSKTSEYNDPYIKTCFDENIIETDLFAYYAKTAFNYCWQDEEYS